MSTLAFVLHCMEQAVAKAVILGSRRERVTIENNFDFQADHFIGSQHGSGWARGPLLPTFAPCEFYLHLLSWLLLLQRSSMVWETGSPVWMSSMAWKLNSAV
jgi:hypothetical protein